MTVTLDEGRLAALASSFSGTLLGPTDDGYEVARRIHNGLVDRHPALIARCLSARDVAAVLGFARTAAYPSRSGGEDTTSQAGP